MSETAKSVCVLRSDPPAARERSRQRLFVLPVFLEFRQDSLLGGFGDRSKGQSTFASETLADVLIEEEFLRSERQLHLYEPQD